jgi:thiamine-monophosphate kinase
LTQSGVGACLDSQALPLSAAVSRYIAQTQDWTMPLTAGDDYELCFTVNPDNAHLVPADCTRIGTIENTAGLRLRKDGHIETLQVKGYEHFSRH